MRYTYHSEQWLPYPVEVVFAFFSNPENLPRLMPPWQKARIEEASCQPPPPRPPTPRTLRSLPSVVAGAGSRLTLSFRPFPYSPIRVSWEAEINDFVWNHSFSDVQLRGPFASWSHSHRVEPESRANEAGVSLNGTLLRDDLEYEMPLGKLGELAKRFIAPQIRSTFAYRRTRTRDLIPLMLA